MPIIVFIIVVIAAYFIGAIPFGLIYGLIRGVDIRKVGSGNIGATNVSRQFGFWGGFVPVFILDFIKGGLPVLIVSLIQVEGFQGNQAMMDIFMLITGFAAILGHSFPIYVGFKGGKAVATSAGVFCAIGWLYATLAIGVFLVVLLIAKLITKEWIVAIASVCAAIALPLIVAFLPPFRLAILIFSIVISLLIIYLHRSNLKKMFGIATDKPEEENKEE